MNGYDWNWLVFVFRKLIEVNGRKILVISGFLGVGSIRGMR
jgi:hypothetical protein